MHSAGTLALDVAPPASIEDEWKTLGAIVIDGEARTKVLDVLLPHDFFQERNRLIYSVIQGLAADNIPLEPQYVRQRLAATPGVGQAGGVDVLAAYFDVLLTASASGDNAIYYAREVLKASRLRDVIQACQATIAEARAQVDDIDGFLAKTEDRFHKLAMERPSQVSYQAMQQLLTDAIDWAEERQLNKGVLSGLDTGLSVINTVTNGLQNDDLILIAARPSIGKTSLMMNIGEYAAAKVNTACGIISAEMGAPALARRFLASGSSVSLSTLRAGNATDYEWDRINEFAGNFYQRPLFIEDEVRDIQGIKRVARTLRAKENIGMLGVDYLQILHGTSETRGNKRLEIAEVCQGLKDIAKELHIPVIALSQLSRQTENRTDKRPQMNDLMESGSIEAIADFVGLLYRKDFYEGQSTEKYTKGKKQAEEIKVHPAELIIGKHRNGETGMVRLGFHAEISRFVNFEPYLADYMAYQYQQAVEAGEET